MSILMHASRSLEAVRPPSNDERRAAWAARYFLNGWHRQPQKPRIRVTPNLPASPDACSRVQVGAGRQSPPPTPAVDDDAGWADYTRRAFAGEFEPF